LPFFQELWEDLRRILQVRIHNAHRPPGTVFQAGADRHLMSEIPGQFYDDDAAIAFGEPIQ
jgi:hypothetical protein